MSKFKINFQVTDDIGLCEADDEFGYIPPLDYRIIEADSESEALAQFADDMYGFRTEIVDVMYI